MPASSLFVVSGPAGAGKGTLVSRVCERVGNVWVSLSATTRAPRGSEVDGVEYRFLSIAEFERLIEQDGFIEWARVHSHYYGTPIEPIRQHLADGSIVLLEIDVQGAMQVKRVFPDATLVFIEPPSMEELERRLRARATDSEEAIRERLENARGELAAAERYDVRIVNDDVETATDELVEVIESHVGLAP